jgi:hypothetical protein
MKESISIFKGQGIYFFPDGARYEGNFENDTQNGPGIWYFASGHKYEGQFKNGNFHGQGNMTWKSGNKYEGNFENDIRSGFGIYINNVISKGDLLFLIETEKSEKDLIVLKIKS